MKKTICGFGLFVMAISMCVLKGAAADDPRKAFRQLERDSVTIELQFVRKDRNAVERTFSYLFDYGPNGNATGFVVGNGLVMTAYHVISGDLNGSKKAILGFKPDDQLEVKAFVNNCRARVINVDQDADLALLQVCGSSKDARRPAFEMTPSKNEKLFLIARPNGDKEVRRGVLYGAYKFHGLEYWSMKIDSRDGFSGSPVYNEKAQVVGLFSGYDWGQKLAVISPAARAQKLLEEYTEAPKP